MSFRDWKNVWVTAFCLLFLTATHGQETWSLKKCIEHSLENHLSNDIFKGNVKKARLMTLENIGLYLPQISGSFSFDDNFKRQTVVLPDTLIGIPITDREVQFGTKFINSASVTLEQALFDRVLLASFRAKKPNMQSAELSFQQNQENLVYNTAQAYIQVYVLKQQIQILNENKKKYEKLSGIVKLQAEKGVAKKVDADKITVALNNTQSQLNTAESGYDLALNRLKSVIGLELSEEIALEDSMALSFESLDNLISGFDAGSKTEAQIQKKTILLLDVLRKRTLGGYFPRLSFYANYGAQSFSDDFSKSFSNWYDYSSIGLNLHVPIFDSFQKGAQAKQAAINLQNAKYNLQLSEESYELQFRNAVIQAQKAQSNLDDTRTNANLAKSIFNNASQQYEQGVAPLSELLSAETSFKEAQSNYLLAMLGYYSAIIELQKAKGTLLSFYQNL